MATLSIELMIESVTSLLSLDHTTFLNYFAIGIVVGALLLKMLLFIYCRALSKYPAARIFAQDHLNDVMFNSIGLAFSIIGAKYVWWLDPGGGILIACLILRSWSTTAYKNVKLLIGRAADPAVLKQFTYIAFTHDPRIKFIDKCTAYHAGDNYIVEIDIVLPPDMTVRDSHDIAASLQAKLEAMEMVERAYVHIDYNVTHPPEHQKS